MYSGSGAGYKRPVSELQDFYSLTPERVLEAVERLGHGTTGLCYALNSLENRVYEVELEDTTRRVVKFYRPARWSKETILDEHRLLSALTEAEIPACAPLPFPSGETLLATDDGIWFALFPRVGGRAPDELSGDDLEQLGRFIARIHNVSESLGLEHRPTLSPVTYGRACLETILECATLSPGVQQRYAEAVGQLADASEQLFEGLSTLVIHADLHRGNLLHHPQSGWLILDFDDSARGPPVQDIWLLLPARPADCPSEVKALLTGYEQFRPFEHQSLRLIEALRGLRYVRYAAWITRRWDDPAFPRAFPHWGTDNYWEQQLSDIYDQLRILTGAREY